MMLHLGIFGECIWGSFRKWCDVLGRCHYGEALSGNRVGICGDGDLSNQDPPSQGVLVRKEFPEIG